MSFTENEVINWWKDATRASWPNCTIPDCQWKVCLGLSTTLCYSHYFNLRMDDNGMPIYPDEKTKRRYKRLLNTALKKINSVQSSIQ